MTVRALAESLGIWESITRGVSAHVGDPARTRSLLDRVSRLSVQRSRSTRAFGMYVTRQGSPEAIRLQFAQEPDELLETFRHELAHAFDHVSGDRDRSGGGPHGPTWRAWAVALGARPERRGRSAALAALRLSRLKVVAVCERCGFRLRRVRRLDRGRTYLHRGCGGLFVGI